MDQNIKNSLYNKIDEIKNYVPNKDYSRDNILRYLKDNVQLLNWYFSKRHSILIGSLSDEEIELYKEKEFDFGVHLYLWKDWAKMLKIYLEQMNLEEISPQTKVNDIYCLGQWAKRQKQKFSRLQQEQQEVLKTCGLMYERKKNKTVTWNQYYKALENCKKKTGNADVSQSYITEEGLKLGQWLNSQRYNAKNEILSVDKLEKLQHLGIDCGKNRVISKIIKIDWNEGICLLKKYLKEFPDKNLKVDYVTNDGKKLGRWYKDTINALKEGRLDFSKVKDLQKLKIKNTYCRGFILDTEMETWNSYYELAKCYLQMNDVYTLSNIGYKREEEIVKNWILKQRKEKKAGNLSTEKIQLLTPLVHYWNAEERRGYIEREQIKNRINQMFENYEEAIISVSIRGMCIDEKTGIMKITNEQSDYYECELLLSGLFSEKELIEYISKNRDNLIYYAKRLF